MSESKRVVQKEEQKPCGCVITHFADGAGEISPCVPCGLMGVAQGMSQAADAMAAIATRLRREEQQAAMAQAIAAATRKK